LKPMDNTNPQDGSKIILHTMEDDLKKATPAPSTGPIPSSLSDVGAPPAPKAPPSFVAPNPFTENKPIAVSAPLAPSAIPQITIPELNPLKKKIIVISTFVVVVLIVFGLGVGLFFWTRSRSSQAPVAMSTPSIEGSLSSSLSAPSPEASLVYPSSVTTFDGPGAVIEYKESDDLNNVLTSKLPLIAQERKAIRILLRQMDYPEGPRFTYLNNVLKALGVLLSPELSKIMTGAGDLFVYKDSGNYRLGFVSSLSSLESYASLSKGLWAIEGGFLSDFAPIFLSANFQTPALKKFEVNATLSPNFVNRYINLVNLPQSNLSLDYAINKSATLFVLATSKNSMFHVINLIEGKK